MVRRRIGYCLPGSFHAACSHLLVAVVGGGALEGFDYIVVVNLVGAQDYVALLLLEPLEVVDFFGAVVVGNLFFIYGFAADIGVGRACGRPDVEFGFGGIVVAVSVESGGENCEFHAVAQSFVVGDTPYDVHFDLRVDFGDECRQLASFFGLECLLGLARVAEVEQQSLRRENVCVFQQRRVQGVVDGVCHTVFALAVAHRNQGGASVAQSGVDVVEVEVYVAVVGNDFGNRACGG